MAFSICWENFGVSWEGAGRRGSQWNQIANKCHQQIQTAKHKTNLRSTSEQKSNQLINHPGLVGAMAKALFFLLLTSTTTAFTTTTTTTTTKEGDIMEKLREHLANTNTTAVGVKDLSFLYCYLFWLTNHLRLRKLRKFCRLLITGYFC